MYTSYGYVTVAGEVVYDLDITLEQEKIFIVPNLMFLVSHP